MCPAATAILRDMLIPHARQVGMTAHILPRETLRQRGSREVGVREGMDNVFVRRGVGDRMILAEHGEDASVRESDKEEREGKRGGHHGACWHGFLNERRSKSPKICFVGGSNLNRALLQVQD